MLLYSLVSHNITQRSCQFEADGDFTHPEEHSERRILKKYACKFNTIKLVDGEPLPRLDAMVLLEDRNYGIAAFDCSSTEFHYEGSMRTKKGLIDRQRSLDLWMGI